MVSNHKTLPLSAWFQKQLNNVFMPFRFGNWQWCLTSLSGKTVVLLTAFTYDPGWDSEYKNFHARPYIMMWLFSTTNTTKLQATCSKLYRKYFICWRSCQTNNCMTEGGIKTLHSVYFSNAISWLVTKYDH